MLSNRIFIDTERSFSYIESCAGVVKLVDARDSKSRGASTPCRFDSDLRHHHFKLMVLVHCVPSSFPSSAFSLLIPTVRAKTNLGHFCQSMGNFVSIKPKITINSSMGSCDNVLNIFLK
jgi:hypothetical protein